MKRFKLLFPALFIGAGMLMVTGCGDDDLSAPSIVLEGDNPQIIDLGTAYTEAGATATGNTAVEERDVWVRATTENYVGFFTVVENCAGSIPAYEIQIERINATTLRVTNLGDFSAGETVYDMEVSGDLNDIVSINGADATDPSLFCTASGELVNGVDGSMLINMSYSFDDGVDSFTCSDVDIEQN
jgi:hypothetical protein